MGPPLPWQSVHRVVMPIWFIAAPLNVVVDLWQVSQEVLVGKWFAGLVTIPPTHVSPAP
jgi:hypothetical protein